MREHGVENYFRCKLAILEVDGNISVVLLIKIIRLILRDIKRKNIRRNFRFLIKLFNLKNELRIKRMLPEDGAQVFANFPKEELKEVVMQLLIKTAPTGKLGIKTILSVDCFEMKWR